MSICLEDKNKNHTITYCEIAEIIDSKTKINIFKKNSIMSDLKKGFIT